MTTSDQSAESNAPVEFTGQSQAPKNSGDKEKSKGDPRQGLPPNVVVEEASAPMDLKPADPDAKGPWIQYNGVGTVRIMDEKTWRSVGVDSDKYYEWSYLNKKRLPRSLFSDAELQYLLRRDGRFSLVEDTPEKESATTE